MQRMGSVPILYTNVNITIDTMLKFDANADADVNIDAQCEWTFTVEQFLRDEVCPFFNPW